MRFVVVVLIVLAAIGGGFLFMRGGNADEEKALVMPIAASETREVAPWIGAAARELGLTKVRAYDSSIFIDVDGDTISFFREDDALVMHVGLESKYRHSADERGPAVQALQEKGKAIFQHALQMHARAQAKDQMATRPADTPAG